MVNKNTVYLSLGSNIRDKKKNLWKALKELKKNHIILLKISSLYKTEPVGVKDQPNFLNLALKGKTILSPDELLVTILNIEKKSGRIRTKKQGPRIIDIDILLYNDLIIKKRKLIIPHPRMNKRNFVLIPLLEIEPDLSLPGFKKNISEYIKKNTGKVKKIRN